MSLFKVKNHIRFKNKDKQKMNIQNLWTTQTLNSL